MFPDKMSSDEFTLARHELGFTQVQMAKLLNVTERTIQHYESGDREVPGPVVRVVSISLALRDKEVIKALFRNIL